MNTSDLCGNQSQKTMNDKFSIVTTASWNSNTENWCAVLLKSQTMQLPLTSCPGFSRVEGFLSGRGNCYWLCVWIPRERPEVVLGEKSPEIAAFSDKAENIWHVERKYTFLANYWVVPLIFPSPWVVMCPYLLQPSVPSRIGQRRISERTAEVMETVVTVLVGSLLLIHEERPHLECLQEFVECISSTPFR